MSIDARVSQVLVVFSLAVATLALGHDGPDPVFHWSLKAAFLENGRLTAQQGPDLPLSSDQFLKTERGLFLKGTGITPHVSVPEDLPKKGFTLAVWCSVHSPQRYGGLIGCQEDNGGYEKGWVLGYDEEKFCVSLSTEETNDGDGKLITLRSKTSYELGKLYHVAATYDGSELKLYVNGKEEGTDTNPGGKIVYSDKAHLSLGGYYDSNENFPHQGQLVSAHVYQQAAKAVWIQQEFDHNADWIEAEVPESIQLPFTSVVDPYLQWVTQTGITVMWETSLPAEGLVHYGEDAECKNQTSAIASRKGIHEIPLTGLKPGTQYFYRTSSTHGGNTVDSEVFTFQTDAGPGVPFAFAVISDTQGNPEVSGNLAKQAWNQRPNFLLHPGDLVSTGKIKKQWVEQFFASMKPLTSRVALFPVLGNHEQNASHYYQYMSLPDPEYYYTFQHGDARFFMLDTNKKCGPGSEQYEWLEKELSECDAIWKFVSHHHPVYSSDENDYGDLWKQNVSSRGDTNARKLAPLYDKYGVDIVWNGHIHSYERTWPIRNGMPAEKEAPIYMITGGGGGHLETPGPFRTPFELIVRKGHHYSMVWINGKTLEFKAYDLEGQLFDSFRMEKP
jgi:predicted phosphodiesterase